MRKRKAEEEEEYALLPHTGHLVLDKPFDQEGVYVVHGLSMERAALPTGGDWFLCYDDQGFACAADCRDRMDPVCIEDLLVKRVCTRNGKLWVVVGHGSDRVIWSVTDKLTRYKQLDISVLVAPSWSKVQCSAVFLDMPRMESRFFWEAAVLYKQLGLTSYGGQASTWFYRGRKPWAAWMRALGLGDGHLLRGLHGNAKEDPEASDDGEEDLFMLYSGMSTCAVLALLTKWSASEPTLHQRQDARWMMPQAARFFLQSLIAGCVRTPQMPWRSINVRFLRSWEIAWPARPPTPPDLVLQVDSVGVLNLQPWIDINNGSPKELPNAWWRALLDAKVVAADTTKTPLAKCLINMVSIAKFKPLFAQLLTQAAQYIEVILLTILKKGFRD